MLKQSDIIPKGYKKCSDCGRILPETTDYFVSNYNKNRNRYYYKCHCRECGKVRSKEWRENNTDKYKNYYSEHNKTAQAKESNKRYKEAHREVIKERKKEYRQKNPDKIKAYDKQRRENPETVEHINAMTRRWRANNKEGVSAYNSQYAKGNKDYFRAAAQKRRNAKKRTESTLTAPEWERAKQHFNYCCAYCGKKTAHLEQEHLIPLSKGGAYAAYNILPACKSCNSKKHDKEFSEWYKAQPFYSEERENIIKDYIKNLVATAL